MRRAPKQPLPAPANCLPEADSNVLRRQAESEKAYCSSAPLRNATFHLGGLCLDADQRLATPAP